MVPPSDKATTQFSFTKYLVRSLHLNAHVFKILPSICTILDKITRYDILNMLIALFLLAA